MKSMPFFLLHYCSYAKSTLLPLLSSLRMAALGLWALQFQRVLNSLAACYKHQYLNYYFSVFLFSLCNKVALLDLLLL